MSFVVIGSHTRNSSLAQAVTLSGDNGGHIVMIQALEQNVRYTLDGTDPTATVGFRLVADQPPVLIDTATVIELRVVEEVADAEIQYQWGTERYR